MNLKATKSFWHNDYLFAVHCLDTDEDGNLINKCPVASVEFILRFAEKRTTYYDVRVRFQKGKERRVEYFNTFAQSTHGFAEEAVEFTRRALKKREVVWGGRRIIAPEFQGQSWYHQDVAGEGNLGVCHDMESVIRKIAYPRHHAELRKELIAIAPTQ